MIIDFHTHIYPDHVAERAIKALSQSGEVKPHLDGRLSTLLKDAGENAVSRLIVLPIATKPEQTHKINERARSIMEEHEEIIHFGAIHPDNTDYKYILRGLAADGFKGIKLHPQFQNTAIDDVRYMRIIDAASDLGMCITVHAGGDFSFPDADLAMPFRIRKVIRKLQPPKLVLAHFGGAGCFDEAAELLEEYPGYVDTSFIIREEGVTELMKISDAQLNRIIRAVGTKRILFGTDSPWVGAGGSIKAIQRLPLKEEEKEDILGNNAKRLLTI